MTKVNTFLTERLKSASSKQSKMTSLAEMSNAGSLSSFAGVFRVTALSSLERTQLSSLLENHCAEEEDISPDLQQLCDITAEVRAINSQAAILHGERIKKAQELLKKYRDGAFTSWLMAAYGNRQTPYNFLQYYELFQALPQNLSSKLDEMPKQIAYILASKQGPLPKKEEIIRNYSGQSKQELLITIREQFPLSEGDKRSSNVFEQALSALQKIKRQLASSTQKPSAVQQAELRAVLTSLQQIIRT